VLKGRYTALVISVIVHMVLFSALVLLSDKQQAQTKKVIKRQEIKSYLYRSEKSKPIPKEVVKINKPNETELPVVKQVQAKQPVTKIEKKTQIKPLAEQVIAVKTATEKPSQTNNATINKAVAPQLPGSAFSSSKNRSHALHNSLSRLRNSIDQQLVNDAFDEHTQVRSASIMHGKQIPVPHSDVKLTDEEEQKKNTKESHTESITKNDNGTCTIVREQILGSPVEASVSQFSCGESKFNKSFREHMQKVQAKLNITNK